MCKDKKIIKSIKAKIRKILNLLKSYNFYEVLNYLKNNTMDTPEEISLSLCHKTCGRFKGIGYCASNRFDELYSASEEEINSEDRKNYCDCLIKDYNHLLDSVEGFEGTIKTENKEFLKYIFQWIGPWILAILPYIIQIINAIKN